MAGNFFDQYDAPAAPTVAPAQPGASNFFDKFDGPSPAQAAMIKQSPTYRADWLRRIALAGRAIGEGVVGIPAAFADAVTGRSGVNAVLAKLGQPELPTASSGFESALTTAGAPVPETSGENFASAAIRGASGALATGPAGLANIARAGLSGVTGSVAQEGARQAGYGPGVQALAGIIGGVTPMAAEGALQTAARAVRPVTRAGQQDAAAAILAEQATNPATAAANLEAAQPVVPGSLRTTGEASRDVGLLTLEKGIRGKTPQPFGSRISEQNAARQAELSSVGGEPKDITAAQTARSTVTDAMREAALGEAKGVAAIEPVHAKIDSILASPVGKRETISKSLNWAKEQIGDTTDPAALYEIRKDLQLAQMGKLQPSSPTAPNASTLALARGQLGDVIGSLDEVIEAAAPGFKAYLARYKEMSKPIDQMKVIQEIRRRAELTSADATTGQMFLGNATFSRALDAALQKSGAKLTPEQVQRLEAIRTDLQYGQAINSPLIKAPGSDTFQNLSIAQVIGAGATDAHPALRVMTKPLQWVYKLAGSDEAVNDLLAQAMLDPKMAAAMLRRATPESTQRFSESLRMWAMAHGLGAAAGSVSTPTPATAPQNTRRQAQ